MSSQELQFASLLSVAESAGDHISYWTPKNPASEQTSLLKVDLQKQEITHFFKSEFKNRSMKKVEVYRNKAAREVDSIGLVEIDINGMSLPDSLDNLEFLLVP